MTKFWKSTNQGLVTVQYLICPEEAIHQETKRPRVMLKKLKEPVHEINIAWTLLKMLIFLYKKNGITEKANTREILFGDSAHMRENVLSI